MIDMSYCCPANVKGFDLHVSSIRGVPKGGSVERTPGVHNGLNNNMRIIPAAFRFTFTTPCTTKNAHRATLDFLVQT